MLSEFHKRALNYLMHIIQEGTKQVDKLHCTQSVHLGPCLFAQQRPFWADNVMEIFSNNDDINDDTTSAQTPTN